ncbi:MAG: hypothetical protein JWN02_1187 [Acidobacteria bacterium]|nr:hypothetical protein [Acidobacteriota bacterium]
MSVPNDEKREFTAGDRWLTLAVFLGPLAALANLTICNSLVPTACEDGSKTMLHVVAAATFLIALAGALIGRAHRRVATLPATRVQERSRWMALTAVWLSIGSAIAIVAMEIPNLILRSCD